MKTVLIASFFIISATAYSQSFSYKIPTGTSLERGTGHCDQSGCNEYTYTKTRNTECEIFFDGWEIETPSKEEIILNGSFEQVKQNIYEHEDSQCLRRNRYNSKLCELWEINYTWVRYIRFETKSEAYGRVEISCGGEDFSAPPSQLSPEQLKELFNSL